MSIVLDGTANTVTPLNGALGATTPSTVAATTVVASSTIKGATTIAVGNATPSASGAGITFPATQSASTDANTLDDYEEGTWTPALAGGATAGYSSRTGTYTKIGNRVVLFFKMQLSSLSGSGTIWMTGVPFTPSGDDGNAGTLVGNSGCASLSASYMMLFDGDSTLYPYTQGTTSRTNWVVSNLTSSALISGTIVFKTA